MTQAFHCNSNRSSAFLQCSDTVGWATWRHPVCRNVGRWWWWFDWSFARLVRGSFDK